MQQTVGRPPRRSAASTALVASLMGTAALLTGCSATDGLMTSVELPAGAAAQQADPGDAAAASALPSLPGASSVPPAKLVVTGQERAYLDALAAGGVHPSSDLLALSIGSYVCQARAAGQSPQAVWDFVYPLVHGDVRNAHLNSTAPTQADVNAATDKYIRIATERLC